MRKRFGVQGDREIPVRKDGFDAASLLLYYRRFHMFLQGLFVVEILKPGPKPNVGAPHKNP